MKTQNMSYSKLLFYYYILIKIKTTIITFNLRMSQFCLNKFTHVIFFDKKEMIYETCKDVKIALI